MIGLTEAERREKYFQQVRGDHPLVELIRGCLDNDPPQRPDAVRILGRLRQMISQSPPSCENKMELLNQTQTLRNEKRGLSEQLEQLQRELTQSRGRQERLELTHSIDMDQVQCRVRELSTEVEGLRAVVSSKKNAIQAKEIEKQQTIRVKEQAIQAKEIEKQQAIEAKEKIIESHRQEIASRDALLAERDATIGQTRGQVKTLQGYLSTNQTVSSKLCVCCVCVCMCVHVCSGSVCACVYVGVCVRMCHVLMVYYYVCMCMCLYVCMCMCMCVYVCICVCVCVCVCVRFHMCVFEDVVCV